MQEQNQDASGLHQGISLLGKAVGLVASIFGTPVLFEATRKPAFLYLYKTWGKDFAELLVWMLGVIEAYVIYATVSLLFTAGVLWGITEFVMRRFR